MAEFSIQASLRNTVLEILNGFLIEEGFGKNEEIQNGILEMINLVSDYYEEGKSLFPEILISNNIEGYFLTIPNRILPLGILDLTALDFKKVIKLCAPLAVDDWIIYINIDEGKNNINYGVVSALMEETSPTIHSQAVGELKLEDLGEIKIAYIRNIGNKVVEISGLKETHIVSLNLDPDKNFFISEIEKVSDAITLKIDDVKRKRIKTYIGKILDQAFKEGHGNLIGIVNDDEENIANIRSTLQVTGGVFLEEPIDFTMLLDDTIYNNGEASTNLRAYSSVFRAMLNHDGIIIMTNMGRVIAYHMLIDGYINDGDVISGGSRSKAFVAMQNCKHFEFCFYKSQDGNIKTWKNE